MMFRGFGFSFLFVFGAAPIIVGIIALVDATRRSDDEWARADQNKTLWIVLIAVGFLLCILGLVVDLVYLLSIRPQLDRAAASPAGTPVGSVAPRAGWYPDPHGRHELRYFDGLRWTESVSDAGAPGVDPR